MRQLEIEKKYTFGLDKTKYMVIDTGKEKEEEIIESVERGMVEKAEEYKCVGLWLNSEGNLKTHIEKKKRIVMGEVNAIKTLGSKENVGPLYLTARPIISL